MSNDKTTGVVVGDVATILCFSDRKAARVIAVNSKGTRITLQEDKAELENGVNSGAEDALKFEPGGFFGHTSGAQRWKLTPDPDGATRDYSLREVGGEKRWIRVGDTKRGERALVGVQHHSYDFNF